MGKLERITTYRISKGYRTAKAFAEFLGISANQISEIDKKGKAASLLLALRSKTDINLDWLETGEGEMIAGDRRKDDKEPRPDAAFDIPRSTSKIPIVSWAQAGPGGFFEDSFPAGSGFGEINRPYDVTDPNAYALIISGDSMVPKYEPGDLIVVSPNAAAQTGDYAVVRLQDGTVTAKRIKAKDDRYILESVNPEYAPLECAKENVILLHRIVWVKQRG